MVNCPSMREAILKEAKARILEVLKTRGEVSIDEATLFLGLAKSTVRQHLLLLERQGLIERTERKAGKGRPLSVYQLSQNASSFFPSQDPALLKELLSGLIADGKTEWVQSFFNQFWEQRIQKFKSRLGSYKQQTQETAQAVLVELLKEEGFMPEVEKEKDGTIIIRECNCPFPEAIKATRIPCRLEAAFINEALNKDFKRTSYIPMGSATCTYVSLPEAGAKVFKSEA